MEIAESDVIVSHLIHGLSCKFISQKCRIALDKGMKSFHLDQIRSDPLDLLRRASMQRGECNGITDIRRNPFNILLRHMLKHGNVLQQILPAVLIGLRILCVLHGLDKQINLRRLDSLQIVSHAHIELESIHGAEPILLRHNAQ